VRIQKAAFSYHLIFDCIYLLNSRNKVSKIWLLASLPVGRYNKDIIDAG